MKRNNLIIFLFLFIIGCKSKNEATEKPLFTVLNSKETGLNFSNNLSYSPSFNLFKYMYFYNGSGIGAGDFNNDGKIDLFFGSNQGQNSLYLNKGDLKFINVTQQAGIPDDGGWTTGISVVDINNDGLLDIYVCRVGKYETLHSKNQFLINKGFGKDSIPKFEDEAEKFGLAFSGFGTQAAFFDYDNDNDLDVFLLNHSVHQNNNFRPRSVFEGTYDSLSGDRIYQNIDGKFEDATRSTKINSTSISYGLGLCIADINLDGYPDLYIGNDFHENDYLYINQKNGTFKDESRNYLMHTSQYSMGIDVADINNDAKPEIISMDMLPSDPYILKRSLGEDTYDLFNEKINMGYYYQYTRNNLQFNRGDNLFSEVGLYSGVAATDWSWAPLWMDMNNDGWKDLFISNGIPKRMNDIDYVNFVTSGEVQQKISNEGISDKDISLIKKFPQIKIPNKFYINKGDLKFSDIEENISGNQPTYSNGAVYADFDNDGDLDVVVNNIDESVLLYKNETPNKSAYLDISFLGLPQNINAIGAKVILYAKQEIRTYENYPVRGFLSSMQIPMHIGLSNGQVDSIDIIWPDRTFSSIKPGQSQKHIEVHYQKGLPLFDFSNLRRSKSITAENINDKTGLNFLHKENHFVEFDREPLIPHMVSTETPCLAVADINGDKLDDVFIGNSRNQPSLIFIQNKSGKFIKKYVEDLAKDSIYESTSACWADINNDGFLDLAVASGGNEFYGSDDHNTPRIYVNDGKGNFKKLQKSFENVFITASTIIAKDFNNDGFVDFFIGGRAEPWAFGQNPKSYLFLNNKNGKFSDVTTKYAEGLSNIGFVTDAKWSDINKDGQTDLLISLEWGSIVSFINNNGYFKKFDLTDKKGWWNFILPADIDGDGDIDLVAGNLGTNSRLKASVKKPVRMYFNDFDGNGKKEQVLTYYIGEKEIPFATKAELEKQMPILKKKFLYAENLSKATLNEIFSEDKLSNATIQTADYFENTIFINKGNLKFDAVPMPWQMQLAPLRDATIVNINGDGLPDIFLVGNYYENNIEMGRYDADYGSLLINKGEGKFNYGQINKIKGQVRHIAPIKIGEIQAYILARNNDSLLTIKFID